MTRKARLSDQQKRRVTQLAREKSLTCPDCGYSEPVPNDEVRPHPDGGGDVSMRCEEAKALGLHSLGEGPQKAS